MLLEREETFGPVVAISRYAPWVGAKQSGFGCHGSPDGHRQFAQIRVLSRLTD